MVNVTPIGGAQEVGASCTLLETEDLAVVVDFGARPGRSGADAYPDLSLLMRPGRPEISALVLTHAHHDHVGGLPVFHRHFRDAKIFGTRPSLRIAEALLSDSLHLMGVDADRSPDYTAEEVQSALRSYIPIDFGEPRMIACGERTCVTARFTHAGHILGASVVTLDFLDMQTQVVARVVLSGDVSGFDQPTIRGTDLDALRDSNPDLLILEGTYGDRDHGDPALEEARFVARVASIVRGGGRVVIPAFAVGRAQNVAVLLRRAQEDPVWVRRALGDPGFSFPRTPVLLDGMARTCSDIYDANREFLHPDLRAETRASRHVLFDDGGVVQRITSVAARNAVLASERPWVAIASSGMLIGGPVVQYARAISQDPRSALFLVGYQDEESPGAVLSKRARGKSNDGILRVRLAGEMVEFRAQAHHYSLSGHSDAAGLEALCAAAVPEKVRLVHGENASLEALRARLGAFLRGRKMRADVGVARRGEPICVQGMPMRFRADVGKSVARPSLDSVSASGRLTGTLSGRGRVGPDAQTRASSVALLHGRNAGVTATDAARLGVVAASEAPLSGIDVERLRHDMERDSGIAWNRRSVQRTGSVFSPSSERRGRSLAERELIAERLRRRPSLSGMNLDIVEAEPGDLVLADVAGRVQPAVLCRHAESGYATLTGAGRAHLSADQVLARVGAWPFPGGGSDAPEVRLLHQISDLLLEMVAESSASGSVIVERENDRLWAAVAEGALDMQDALTAQSLLLLPAIGEGVSLAEASVAVGEEEIGPSEGLIDSLDRLSAHGFVHFLHSGQETVVRWGSAATHGTVSASERLEDLLGPGLAQRIRVAGEHAVRRRRTLAEARAQAVSSSASGRMETVLVGATRRQGAA